MERNTITTIDKLEFGDRFYKASDKTRKVYTKVPVRPLKNKYRTLQYGALKDGEKFPNHMTVEIQLVFLRHAETVGA